MKETQNFTEGKSFSPLIQFALPVLFALFLQTMYGAIDLLVVGQFGGNRAGEYVSAVFSGELPFALSIKDIRPKGTYIKHILKIGMPIALQDLLVSISFLVIIVIVDSL